MNPIDTPTVWIVDDDPDDQFLIEHAFRALDPPVTIKQLEDGEELLPCLQQAAVLPRLVILDLNMPRLNGFEALRQLRNIPAYEAVLVVVLTTSGGPADRLKSIELGANGFLTKPASLEGLQHLIRQLVNDWALC